ncbi:MAG TPA: hypothetical protein VG603_09340 [Chitinophagales bacterium]|nr:hypothetical protein [Chitinophagales bacterium]
MRTVINTFILVISLLSIIHTQAQDSIFISGGKVLTGKIQRVGAIEVLIRLADYPNGPDYAVDENIIDSVVYASGRRENLMLYSRAKRMHNNIPDENTISFDPLGFAYLSISFNYEHRVANGTVGLCIPLYVGFVGGSPAGMGLFKIGTGIITPRNFSDKVYADKFSHVNYSDYTIIPSGGSFATGLRVKYYLYRHRVARVFMATEADLGLTSAWVNDYTNGYNQQSEFTHFVTFAFLGKSGVSINPTERFNLTIEGGVGITEALTWSQTPIGFSGLWQLGVAFGVNFPNERKLGAERSHKKTKT